jgi:hypothetical protein
MQAVPILTWDSGFLSMGIYPGNRDRLLAHLL